MTESSTSTEVSNKHKVVITSQNGSVVRGYYCADAPADLKVLDGNSQFHFHKVLGTCISEDETQFDVDWSQLKAVFFVSSFEGDREHQPLRFYTSGPELQNLWVEIVFTDGEIIEGCIRNSLHHLKGDGFFLHPSTPGGNNLLIYVNKAALVSYRVLGVRTMDNG
jgi:hypothetical protein